MTIFEKIFDKYDISKNECGQYYHIADNVFTMFPDQKEKGKKENG